MSKKSSPGNRKKFLAEMRKRLEEMQAKLLSEVDEELRSERDGAKDEGRDTYDLASEEREREINFILSDRGLNKIREIEEALARLDDGSYGICESCGLEIAEPRLEAMPFTRLCRDCQQEHEREERWQRRNAEDRFTYRRLGMTDTGEEEG